MLLTNDDSIHCASLQPVLAVKELCRALLPCKTSHNRFCHNDLFSSQQLITRVGVSTKWIKSVSVRSHVPKWLIISCHLERGGGGVSSEDVQYQAQTHFIAWAKSIRETSTVQCYWVHMQPGQPHISEMDVLVYQWIIHLHTEPLKCGGLRQLRWETMKSHTLTFLPQQLK